MKKQLKKAAGGILSLLILAACQKEINHPDISQELNAASSANGKLKNDELELNISGLENLGPNARYEGWVIIDGSPVSTGVFTVNNAGQMSQTVFEVSGQAVKIILLLLPLAGTTCPDYFGIACEETGHPAAK